MAADHPEQATRHSAERGPTIVPDAGAMSPPEPLAARPVRWPGRGHPIPAIRWSAGSRCRKTPGRWGSPDPDAPGLRSGRNQIGQFAGGRDLRAAQVVGPRCGEEVVFVFDAGTLNSQNPSTDSATADELAEWVFLTPDDASVAACRCTPPRPGPARQDGRRAIGVPGCRNSHGR